MMFESAMRYSKTFAVIIMDINQFKRINDTLGHSVGDQVLKAFAKQLAKVARRSDTIGRWGGDEFLYLIENDVSFESIANCCCRLRDTLSFSVELEKVGLSLSASIGAAVYPIDARTIGELLEAADQAMYEAKRSGSGFCLAFERTPSGRVAPDVHADAVADVTPLPSPAKSLAASASASGAAKDASAVAARHPAAPVERRADRPHLASAPSGDAAMDPPDSVHRYADRRIEPRYRVFKRGILAINNGFSTIDCVVRDLSPRGARVKLLAPVDMPLNRVSLVVTETGDKFTAVKRWQNGQDLGFQFLDQLGRPLNKEAKKAEAISTKRGSPDEEPLRKPALRRAFVVDDERQVRAFVSKALATAGFAATEFTRMAEVDAALTLVKPELIVLDLSLGDTDGVEILRSIARSRFAGNILLISGHDLNTLEEVRKIGVHHGLAMLPVLHKPFRLQEFLARLAKIPSSDATSTAGDLLSAALRNNWLEVWYQPKVALRSMLIRGVEALVRLRHPDRGILPPSAFLPPPGTPLYQPLTDFVVKRTLADWSSMAAAQATTGAWANHRIAINVPASVLRTHEFIDNILRRLPQHPQFPGLMVEITEDEAFADPEQAREITIQLKLHNILVSIDDFGSGYSSLERLTQVPFAEVKLDRSFVDGCSIDKRKNAICKQVVDFAHRGKMIALAEGIETVADLETLIGMGYDLGQGLLLAEATEWQSVCAMLASPEPIDVSQYGAYAKEGQIG